MASLVYKRGKVRRRLHYFASSSDWFIRMSRPVVIGRSDLGQHIILIKKKNTKSVILGLG